MNLEERIYEGLRDLHGASPEVYLEDLLRISCGQRHAFRLRGVRGVLERGPALLLHESALRVRRVVCGYLKGCYPGMFKPGSFRTEGGVTLLLDGFLGDRLVEVSVVSTREFNATRPPRRSVLSAAVKAHVLGASEALLILFDRNRQDWAFWTVTGDLARAAEPVLHDIRYVASLTTGDALPLAMASAATCRRCPYVEGCGLAPGEDPPNYMLHGVQAVPDVPTKTEVEGYLWKLNARDNGRTKKVIHPSSFSLERCDREIAYDLLGTEEEERVDPKLRRIFDVGHCIHDLVQEMLCVTVPGFQPETPVVNEELRIHGHCDGEFGDEGVEIKSIGQDGFDKLTSAKAEHRRQATIYGANRDLKLIHYIYVNKETGEIKTYEVKLNRTSWHKQAARAANLVKAVDAGQLPPPIDSDYHCKSCKYAWTCKPQTNIQPKRTFS